MPETDERVTYVFEAKGGEAVKRQLEGIATGFGTSKRDANAAAKDIKELKNILEFSKGIKTTKDLEAALKKHPQLAQKMEAAYKRLRTKEVNGLTGAFANLTFAEKRQLVQMRQLNAEVKKSHGITGAFKQGIMGAVPALGMMATGAGAVTLVGQKLIRMLGDAVNKIKEFISTSLELGADQEEGRTIMQALIGDLEAGTAAYDEFDKRVTNSPFKREAYNLRDYAAAVKVGMGEAYLDAAEAGNVYNFSAASFIENMYKMEHGLLRSANTLGQFSAVLEHTGIDINDVKNGTISYKEVVEAMKVAVGEMADEQNRAAGTTGRGALNLIKNYWNDIKEDIGEALISYLKPMGVEIYKIIKDVRSMKELWKVIGWILKEDVAAFVTGPLIGGMKLMVSLMQSFQWAAEKGAQAWAFIAEAMGREVKTAKPPEPGAVPPSGYGFGEEGETGGKAEFTPITHGGKWIETAPGVYESIEAYNKAQGLDKYGKPLKTGGGKKIPTPLEMMRAEAFAFQEEVTAVGMRHAGAGPEAPLVAAPGVTEDLEDRYQEIIAGAMEDKKTIASITSGFAIGLKDAVMSGDVRQGFIGLGLNVADSMLARVIESGIFSLITGQGFWSVFKGGFEQEGVVRKPTLAMVAEKVPEGVFRLSTLRAISQGFSPRGGRSDARYGPEDYRGGGGDTYININPAVSPLLDIEMAKRNRRGTALLGQREA